MAWTGTDPLVLNERASTPATIADVGQIYARDVSGVTELHYVDSAGAVTQITSAGVINAGELGGSPTFTNVTATGWFRGSNGSAGAPSYSNVNFPSQGMWWNGTGDIRISTTTLTVNTVLISAGPGVSGTFVGAGAVETSGDLCSAVGVSALYQNTGTNCSAMGASALYQNTGANCSAVGVSALYQNTGVNNTAFGYHAGYNGGTPTPAQNNCVHIGYNANSSVDSLTNVIVIGASAQGTISNQVTLGNSSITSIVGGSDNGQDSGSASRRWHNIYFGTQALGSNGSAAAPTYSVSAQPNSGWYWGAGDGDSVGYSYDGAHVFDIGIAGLAGGGVGIYTAWVLGWHSTTSSTSAFDVILSRDAAAVLQMGVDVNGAAVAQTFKAHDGITGTDIAGANLILAGGRGTGAGAVGNLIFQTSSLLGSGTTAQTLATRLTLNSLTLTFADALDIAFNGTTGTKIGNATSNKFSFWNATPVIQQAHIADPTGGATVDAEARTAINAINALCATLGLTAAS
jgi:hypothetical protein